MGEGHDHGPSAVDVEGELRGSARKLGLSLLVLGALALSGGVWFLSRSRALSTPERRVEAVLEHLAGHPAAAVAERAGQLAGASDAAAWWWAGELARRAGDAHAARERFERAAALAPGRDEPREALAALDAGRGVESAWVDGAAADALEALAETHFPSPGR